jgi:hypothetical protein
MVAIEEQAEAIALCVHLGLRPTGHNLIYSRRPATLPHRFIYDAPPARSGQMAPQRVLSCPNGP